MAMTLPHAQHGLRCCCDLQLRLLADCLQEQQLAATSRWHTSAVQPKVHAIETYPVQHVPCCLIHPQLRKDTRVDMPLWLAKALTQRRFTSMETPPVYGEW